MAESIPILMYHAVTEQPSAATGRLSVTPGSLNQQLTYLSDCGYTGLTLSRLSASLQTGAQLPERPVVLTFDDGYADFAEEAWPILQRHGFPATVFITTGWISDANAHSVDGAPSRMLSWAQIRRLADSGVEIGAHSHSHPQLDQVHDARLMWELAHSRELLQDGIGAAVVTLAYPFGYSTTRVRSAAQAAGFQCAAAVRNIRATPVQNPFMLPRLTIRRATDMRTFAAIVSGSGVLTLGWERLLTAGWAPVRAVRRIARGSGKSCPSR